MAYWTPSDYPEPESTDRARVREFMKLKYERKKWHVLRSSLTAHTFVRCWHTSRVLSLSLSNPSPTGSRGLVLPEVITTAHAVKSNHAARRGYARPPLYLHFFFIIFLQLSRATQDEEPPRVEPIESILGRDIPPISITHNINLPLGNNGKRLPLFLDNQQLSPNAYSCTFLILHVDSLTVIGSAPRREEPRVVQPTKSKVPHHSE